MFTLACTYESAQGADLIYILYNIAPYMNLLFTFKCKHAHVYVPANIKMIWFWKCACADVSTCIAQTKFTFAQ